MSIIVLIQHGSHALDTKAALRHHASPVLTAMTYTTLLLVLCVGAVLPTLAIKYTYEVKYLDVPVDHFSFTSNATFRLRYLQNATYWQKHTAQPIFFYTGNEGDIEMFAQNTGFMWEIAPEFGALVVFAEHRYYGASQPFGNKSYTDPKYLGYLTSQQALADYVLVISHLQREQDRPSPVIAFGGSYGGMLAAYFRMKYPHVIAGAIAASAPIFQFSGLTPCEVFYRIVTSAYSSASTECAASIRKSWAEINDITSSDAGKSWLSTNWKLCKPLKTADDVKDLKSWLSDAYTNLAMINYPYPSNFLVPVPAEPVAVMCTRLPDSSLTGKILLKSLFKAITIYFNYTGSAKCLDVGTQASTNLGDLGWDFQACTEMVMPMCSDGHNDMFEVHIWNFAKYSDECYKKWKVRPDEYRVIRMYGGKDISTATNIVFSNGLLDPWSSGGMLHNLSSSTVAVIIPEGAHHLDLRASNPADPVSVRMARNVHRKFIHLWLQNHKLPEHMFHDGL